ncbi:hypothetical protein [Streptomyces sp. NPDC059957]|uniref:hypothetical protein n=1 Tax=Streptomyces sp. NPDC059957 TaxID=3347016 RepID=UPI003651EEAF
MIQILDGLRQAGLPCDQLAGVRARGIQCSADDAAGDLMALGQDADGESSSLGITLDPEVPLPLGVLIVVAVQGRLDLQ